MQPLRVFLPSDAAPPPLPTLPSPHTVQRIFQPITASEADNDSQMQRKPSAFTFHLPSPPDRQSSVIELASQPSASADEVAIDMGGEGEGEGETETNVALSVMPSPRSLTRQMTSEYTIRPTPLLEQHRHEALLASLLKMGFADAIAEQALLRANFASVELAVEAALQLMEEAEEDRAIRIRQQALDGEEEKEMDDSHYGDDVGNGTTVMKESPSFDNHAHSTPNDHDHHDHALALTIVDDAALPSANAHTEWACLTCTYSNKASAKRCEMCSSRSSLLTQTLPSITPRVRPVPYTPANAYSNADIGADTVNDSNPIADEPNCMICFECVPSSQLVRSSCKHSYCRECWLGYLQTKINDGSVVNILCPDPKCARVVTKMEIEGHVTPVQFSKYVKFLTNAKISMDPNARWCATPGCESVMTGSRSKSKLTCPKCKSSMCWSCNEQWHGTLSCEDAANKSMANYRRNHDVKTCPQCHVIIERVEGCSHVTCTRCKYEFCWLCSQRYTKHHFALWNVINGCPGLQDGSLSWIGNDKCCCCSCGLGCGFAGAVKRFFFRLWVVFALGFTVLSLFIPVSLALLLFFPCVCWYYRRRKRAKEQRRAQLEKERAERRERRRKRAMARDELDENGNALSVEERRARRRARVQAQEAKELEEAIRLSAQASHPALPSQPPVIVAKTTMPLTNSNQFAQTGNRPNSNTSKSNPNTRRASTNTNNRKSGEFLPATLADLTVARAVSVTGGPAHANTVRIHE